MAESRADAAPHTRMHALRTTRLHKKSSQLHTHNQRHAQYMLMTKKRHTFTHERAPEIDKSGYNLRDEPYGTSMDSSITQSKEMAGSLLTDVSVCVCICVGLRDRVSSSPVCTLCQLTFKG